jgi:uncharacterized membrane protein YccC
VNLAILILSVFAGAAVKRRFGRDLLRAYAYLGLGVAVVVAVAASIAVSLGHGALVLRWSESAADASIGWLAPFLPGFLVGFWLEPFANRVVATVASMLRWIR